MSAPGYTSPVPVAEREGHADKQIASSGTFNIGWREIEKAWMWIVAPELRHRVWKL